MFEQKHQNVIPRRQFVIRLLKSLGVAVGVVVLALSLGIAGYHWIVGLSWIDALLNASMILTGMGSVNVMTTNGDKLFASAYALFSGVVFVTVTALILTPIAHRIIHLFHYRKDQQK